MGTFTHASNNCKNGRRRGMVSHFGNYDGAGVDVPRLWGWEREVDGDSSDRITVAERHPLFSTI